MLHTASSDAILEALPAVKSLSDCAEYSKVVEPFLSQLRIPESLPENLTDTHYLLQLYLTTNPFISGLAFSIALAPIFLVISEINQNYSQVDRLWSLLPTLYHVHYAVWARLAGLETEHINTVLIFSFLWSTRLTYNYWRKGGYSIGSEDYRWEIVRKRVGRFAMFLFNVAFISSIQSVLLFLLTAPSYIIMLATQVRGGKMDLPDVLFSRALMALVLFEWFADQQQWNYQNAKKQYQKTAKVPLKYAREDLDRGFVASGLWNYSRHPNFLAEQAIWAVLYAWSCFITRTSYHWAGTGSLSLILLFASSTWLTELISAKKYPEYKDYQKQVPMFLPRLFGPQFGSKAATNASKTKKK